MTDLSGGRADSVLRRLCSFAVCGVLLGSPLPATAEEQQSTSEQIEFFEKRIRPVLVEQCYSCHSKAAKKIQGGLLLDTRAGIRAGGDSGPGVVPGDEEESLVLSALRHESFEMPPKGRLAESVLRDFATWIREGAVDPREGEATKATSAIDIEHGKSFWAFRPIETAKVPSVRDKAWPVSAIDAFLLRRLEQHGLRPSHDADRVSLIRRAYYALIGLPPSPEAVDAFLADQQPHAFAAVIDQLLQSKQFGERWGRHWLDVVRYAESSGGGRTLLFRDAWRYRDYVIDAFNRDLPFDQFLTEQIAGDLLPSDDWRTRRQRLVATAFLLLGPTNYELQDKDVLEMDIVDEQLDTLGKAMLGMTLGCARCHDHKFDPIPMADYYALAGILKSTKSVIHSNVSTWNVTDLPLPREAEQTISIHEGEVAQLKKQIARVQRRLKHESDKERIEPESLVGIVVDDEMAELVGSWTKSTAVRGFVGANYIHDDGQRSERRAAIFTPDLEAAGEYEVLVSHTPATNRSRRVAIRVRHVSGETLKYVDQTKSPPSRGSLTSLGVYQLSPGNAQVVISNEDATKGVVIADAVVFRDVRLKDGQQPDEKGDSKETEDLQTRLRQLEKQLKTLEASGPSRPRAMAVGEREQIGDIHLAIRGVVHNKGPRIPRGVLQVATWDESMTDIPAKSSGRRELAEWITHPQNPLMARVFVNRVWYWLFGEGLVRTVDNFGATGETPTHPELLDYLAAEFIEDGFSTKRLIRRLMLTRLYQLETRADDHARDLDPDNRLWWRMNRQRLDAESLRDTLLVMAGELNTKVGGPHMTPGTKTEYGYQFNSNRRSVYLPVFRNTLPEIFSTFDFADPNVQGGRRTTSTIAPQALYLMNHTFVIDQTRKAARVLLEKQFGSQDDRIEYAYRSVLGRRPSREEHALAAEFLVGDQAGKWALFLQTLVQSIDFRYVN